MSALDQILFKLQNRTAGQEQKITLFNAVGEERKILNGKYVSELLLAEIEESVASLIQKVGRFPGFAIIQIGNNAASNVYIENKKKIADRLNFYCEHHKFDSEVDVMRVAKVIIDLNMSPLIDGIIIQLPLDAKFKHLLYMIAPHKDIDGLGYIQQARLALNLDGLRPCTPMGVVTLLKFYKISLESNFCIVGRSILVGQSLGLMLLHENATVNILHSRTRNIREHMQKADIICLAAGVPEFVKSDWVNEKSVIIDIAISKQILGENQLIVGDLARDAWSVVRSYSPVPGGVGPMTVAALMSNVFKAYCESNGIEFSSI